MIKFKKAEVIASIQIGDKTFQLGDNGRDGDGVIIEILPAEVAAEGLSFEYMDGTECPNNKVGGCLNVFDGREGWSEYFDIDGKEIL